jgi:lysosomal acid lipase/cholesteryl ester hydrolase
MSKRFSFITYLFLIISVIHSKNTLIESNTPDYESIIKSYGYDFEEHTVTTEDGYINTIWKIPSKSKSYFLQNNNKKAIVLQHGLLDDGWTWFALRENSLPFKLSDDGYDVYISHVRGTLFSTGHVDQVKII